MQGSAKHVVVTRASIETSTLHVYTSLVLKSESNSLRRHALSSSKHIMLLMDDIEPFSKGLNSNFIDYSNKVGISITPCKGKVVVFKIISKKMPLQSSIALLPKLVASQLAWYPYKIEEELGHISKEVYGGDIWKIFSLP